MIQRLQWRKRLGSYNLCANANGDEYLPKTQNLLTNVAELVISVSRITDINNWN